MKPFVAIGAGAIGAIVGALLWGAIAAIANVEIGWIAIGVGWLIGFLISVCGGRGAAAALISVGLTVLSICGGKLLSVSWTLDSSIQEYAAEILTEESYQEYKSNAETYIKIQSDDNKIREFIVMEGFQDSESIESPDQISNEELASFKAEVGSDMVSFCNNSTNYETWRGEALAEISSYISQNMSFTDRLMATLGFIDIIFFVIAIGASYQVVMNNEQ